MHFPLMKLTATILTVVVLLSALCSCKEVVLYNGNYTAINLEKKTKFVAEDDRGTWGNRADNMENFIYTNVMGSEDIFNNVYPLTKSSDNDTFNYWIQAQMVDSMTDAYIRTGDVNYAQRAKDLIAAVKKKNGNHLTNDYYDDMGWMACAMAKLYEATGDEDLWNDLLLLYEVITDAWYYDGGIIWSKDTPAYRNSPANGPACILACRMYNITGDQKYLDMALQIFEWWDNTLVDHDTGLVWDGINREGNKKIDKDWKFTYCQGVYIGACSELYSILRDQTYLDKAVLTADYTTQNLVTSDGILQDEGTGDGGAFKGIFCRYLAVLIKTTEINRQSYVDFLVLNAETMWSNIPSEEVPLCGSNWSSKGKKPVQLHVLTSGMALLESVASLHKLGYVE